MYAQVCQIMQVPNSQGATFVFNVVWQGRIVATGKDELLAMAKGIENVARFLEGKAIVKEIVVPGRLVNFVVRPA